MGFSRQEYWSELPCPPPGDLPDPGTEPAFLMSPALAGVFFTTRVTWEALSVHFMLYGGSFANLNVHVLLNMFFYQYLCLEWRFW